MKQNSEVIRRILAALFALSCLHCTCNPQAKICQITSPEPKFIRNRVSGLCLGVRGVDKHEPGAGVEVYLCRPGGADKGLDNRWTFEPADEGYFRIRNQVSNLCLGVRGFDKHDPGTDVEVYYCDPVATDARRDALWKIEHAFAQYDYIKNRVSDLCLGVRGVDDHGPGAGAEVYRCNPGGDDPGQDNQWVIGVAKDGPPSQCQSVLAQGGSNEAARKECRISCSNQYCNNAAYVVECEACPTICQNQYPDKFRTVCD